MVTKPDDSTFKIAARRSAIAWKLTSATLPEAARDFGAYRQYPALPFCLPKEFNHCNLLPGARSSALQRFEAAGIPWHDGVAGGPSNHLLSSQVQCANTLAPFVEDPDALAEIFGDSLPIAQVLPFGARDGHAHLSPFDATDHVVFEWQGLANHLNEWNGVPTRGSQATSADAALRYEATDGAIELALIEWKYTERYPSGKLSTSTTSNATRHARYSPLLGADDSPLDMSNVDLDDLLVEPVYQLMRLVLLGYCIERAHEQDVDRVRVLYVSPSANGALHASPCSDGYRKAVGPSSYHATWPSLLRHPDRMVFMDSRALLDPRLPLDDEFRARYSALGGTGDEYHEQRSS